MYRFQQSFDEIKDILDLKYIPTKKSSSPAPGIYKVTGINLMLKHLFPNNVKISITIDDLSLQSNVNINQTLIFTKKSFFYTKLGFVESHLGVLGDTDGFVHLMG